MHEIMRAKLTIILMFLSLIGFGREDSLTLYERVNSRWKANLDSIQILVGKTNALSREGYLTVYYMSKEGVWYGGHAKKRHRGSYEIGEGRMKYTNYLLTPKKVWQAAINRLYQLKIDTLPNMHDLPNFSGYGTDGISYYYIFRAAGKERTVSYSNTGRIDGKSEEVKNSKKIRKVRGKYFRKTRT